MGIIQMSITGAILILVIALVRQIAIHKLPKITFVILWGIVLLRLLIPFSLNLPASTRQSTEYLAGDAVAGSLVGSVAEMGAQNTAPDISPRTDIIEAINTFNALLPDITENITQFSPITTIWVIGMLAVALFVLVIHYRSRKEYKSSLPVDNAYINKWLDAQRGIRKIQVRQSDRITAPLTYGIIRPVILFPKTTDWQDTVKLQYILTHELTHIKRLDILQKWLLVVALCIHWFNPLVWAMFILASRDIELSCDEAVVSALGESAKSTYAMALIGLEERRSIFAPLCTSFSKNLVEQRIVAIMKIKKRSAISMIIPAILVTMLTIGVLTVFASNAPENTPDEGIFELYSIFYEGLYVDEASGIHGEVFGTHEEAPDTHDEASGTHEEAPDIHGEVSDIHDGPPDSPDENLPLDEQYEPPTQAPGPYRIATTLEEARAIIAQHDGTIPVTNVDVPEIRDGAVNGIIITEQCLYEALAVLNEVYRQSRERYGEYTVPPIRHLITSSIQFSPEPTPEQFVDIIINTFVTNVIRAAMELGYIEYSRSIGLYPEEFELVLNELDYLFSLHSACRRTLQDCIYERRVLSIYCDTEFPPDEIIREAAVRLFGGQQQ